MILDKALQRLRWLTAPTGVVGQGQATPVGGAGILGYTLDVQLLEYRSQGVIDSGLAGLARSFSGPWPYLELMAQKTGAGGPFSRKIVEAYWVGNELLDQVDTSEFGNAVEAKFKARTGRSWPGMAEAIPGGVPHHSFHVFVTYPWVGLLIESHRGEPERILDQCRIRWGRVEAVQGERLPNVARQSHGTTLV